MKIACICVTEDRAPIWGIALTSFLTQTYRDARLLVSAHPIGSYINDALVRLTDASPAHAMIDSLVSISTGVHGKAHSMRAVTVFNRPTELRGRENVPKALDDLCDTAFSEGCDVVTIWDDDDWAPPDRLQRTADAFKRCAKDAGSLDKHPIVASYRQGWMVNLRTFEGRRLELPHLWGGCLALNEQAWLQADGFSDAGRGAVPGYDRQLVERLQRRGLVQICNLQHDREVHEGSVDARDDPFCTLPVAFCHDKNVASFACGEGVTDASHLVDAMPPMVQREARAAQQLMIDRRVFPPGTGDSKKGGTTP